MLAVLGYPRNVCDTGQNPIEPDQGPHAESLGSILLYRKRVLAKPLSCWRRLYVPINQCLRQSFYIDVSIYIYTYIYIYIDIVTGIIK